MSGKCGYTVLYTEQNNIEYNNTTVYVPPVKLCIKAPTILLCMCGGTEWFIVVPKKWVLSNQ